MLVSAMVVINVSAPSARSARTTVGGAHGVTVESGEDCSRVADVGDVQLGVCNHDEEQRGAVIREVKT